MLDPLQSSVTPQIIGDTTLTVIVVCTSSLVEKDHATDLTLNTVQKISKHLALLSNTTTAENFAIQLVWHMLQPYEPAGCNITQLS